MITFNPDVTTHSKTRRDGEVCLNSVENVCLQATKPKGEKFSSKQNTGGGMRLQRGYWRRTPHLV
ncbi:MAG TPA: hypothetical protein PLR13_11505, partial [Smithella sp.]|nr:hypothetical protein [Smithella sp.]